MDNSKKQPQRVRASVPSHRSRGAISYIRRQVGSLGGPVSVGGARETAGDTPLRAPMPRPRTFTVSVSLTPRALARRVYRLWRNKPLRVAFAATALVLVVYEIIPLLQPKLAKKAYAIGAAEMMLPKASDAMAEKLHHDDKEKAFVFNAGFVPKLGESQSFGGPQITAMAYDDPSKGVKVTDPVNKLDFGMKPKFRVLQPRQEKNRVVYPLASGTGWLVYTMQASRMKEDILLERSKADTLILPYELELPSGSEARVQKNGSIGVFGTSLPLTGNISTGSEKDAELLEKARQKAPKDKLLFTIPAPVVFEHNKTQSVVKSTFALKNNQLKVVVENLKKARYPLTIDPSIYVETAAKFMRANNESNIDFDSENELIEKGILTGGRINSWSTSGMATLQNARWGQAATAAGGFLYSIGGRNASANQSDVQWAKLDISDHTAVPPTPGANGQCSNWCTDSAYDLPAARSGLATVIYNGYMYAIGGNDSSCTVGNVTGVSNFCYTVYVAKLGVNGEPQLWRPTVGDPFAYWYRASDLLTERAYSGVVAHKGRLYVVGGYSSTTGGLTTLESTTVNPNGTIGSWSTSGMTSMIIGRWGHATLQYNGYLYVGGGALTSFPLNDFNYIKINSDGSLASSWAITTNNLAASHVALGGSFATIWGGYIYVNGGCSGVTDTSGVFNCTTVLSNDTLQIASINADGSLTDWTSITGVTMTRAGFGMTAWRNTLYAIGGCGTTTSGGNCASPLATTAYGTINDAGDVSPKETINFSTLGTPIQRGNSNGQIGYTAAGVVVNDGYIYNMGGCATSACTSMSDNSAFAPITVDGTIGTWTVDNAGFGSPSGIGAAGAVVYNNYVYMVGGTTGAVWQTGVWRAPLNVTTDHSIGTWTQQTGILPAAYGWSGVTTRSINGTSGYMYIIGGCSGGFGTGLACYLNLQTTVRRCTISHATGALSGCANLGAAAQLPDLDAATAGSQGLGTVNLAVWGDYIYLASGVCGSQTALGTPAAIEAGCDATTTDINSVNNANMNKVLVAKFDASGDIVAPGFGSSIDGTTVWRFATARLTTGRRLGASLAINGYLYVAGGEQYVNGNGTNLFDVEMAKINPDTGDLHPFTTLSQNGSTSIITGGWGLSFVANAGYFYLVGGCQIGDVPTSCSSTTSPLGSAGMQGPVDKLQVYNNYSGSPQYTTSNITNLTDRYGASAVAYDGYLYVVGGCTAVSTTDCTTYSNGVFYAPINSDGSLGNWTAGTTTGFSNRAFGCLAAAGGYLYYLGGRDGTASAFSTVFYSQLSAGAPGAWSTATGGVGDTAGQAAQARYNPGCATVNNKLYVTGGSDTTPTYSSAVYVSPSLAGGGNIAADSWTSTTALPSGRNGHVIVGYGNTLYMMGGFDGTNYLLDTAYAPVNSDGTVGSWKSATPLQQPVGQGAGFAANGYLYLFAGRSASTTCSTDTYVAPIVGYEAGTSNRWGIGTWSQANVTYSGNRHGLAAVYNEGKAYVIGGMCNGALTNTTRVVQASLWAQPQIASYSMMIDTDTDVFPTYWLLNGVDYGIGAQWKLQYKTSTSDYNASGITCATMTTWGQVTTVSAVELKRLGVYTPKDVSGADTDCARYYFLDLTVDASQAFGFAEDVTRGPTIADFTLFFTSDPAKRLRHGKTFTGGQLQPLDTPPDPTVNPPQ